VYYKIATYAATLVALTEASAKGDVEVAKFLAQNPRVAQTFLKEGMRRGIRSLRAPLDGLDYFSGTPFLWGNRAAKFIWRPCGQRREQVDPYYVNTFGENFLSKDIVQQVATKGICFNFFVQLQTDPEAHPIEDSSVNWDEVLSVPQKVGTLQIPRQLGHSKSMKAKCEISKFNPWNGLESHRPLGNTNRARKLIYAGSRKQRGL
jgi:hypothetical protein